MTGRSSFWDPYKQIMQCGHHVEFLNIKLAGM
jgi:hypothetical protein